MIKPNLLIITVDKENVEESLNDIKQTALRGLGDTGKYKVYGLVGFVVREDTVQLLEKK